MKTKNYLLPLLATFLLCCVSCKDKDIYPIITELGEHTYTGLIAHSPMPHTNLDYPPLPGIVFGFTSINGDFVLSYEGRWYLPDDDQLIIDGVEYVEDDYVEITGTARRIQMSSAYQYQELKIATIKKNPI